MLFSLPRLLIVVLAATASAGACAAGSVDHNRFKWHDAVGNLHYSDELPPDAVKSGYEVVSPKGLIVKRVERAKTTAELSATKTALAKTLAEHDAAAAHTRADQQLLSGYPAESDLKRAQQQKLEMLDQQVNAARISLRSQEQTLADLLSRAAEAERDGKTLPETQVTQLAKTRKQVDDQRLVLERRQGDRDNASAQLETETARYRELKAKLAEQQHPAQ